MSIQEDYQKKLISIEDFAKMIKSGDNIATGLGLGGVSVDIHNALLNRADELENVTWGDAVQLNFTSKLYDVETMTKLQGKINSKSFFVFNPVRKLAASKVLDFVPVMGNDCSANLYNFADVFVVAVTPPDKSGYVCLGLSNFYSYDVIMKGREEGRVKLVVGEVNDQMPIVNGNNFIHISKFDYFIENSHSIPTFGRGKPSELEQTIGNYVLELIDNGDCLQMGIGTIPEAVVAGLEGKHDLGIHTEMVPMGLNDLVAKGIVTNNKKAIHKGITVATFCMGDKELYEYVAENRSVELHPAAYVNHPVTIAQNPNVVAINMGLLCDLTGQIVAEGFGHRHISGTGGAVGLCHRSTLVQGGEGCNPYYFQ